jgi:hypothetical protein
MSTVMLTPSSLSPELAELDRQFAAAKAEASDLVDGLVTGVAEMSEEAHRRHLARNGYVRDEHR